MTIESLGLALVAFALACGTTVITPQPGHEWCVEVQTPMGSVSDPIDFNIFIAEPDTNTDPEGCLCFTAAEDQILEEGAVAEQSGQPLPAGYEALRDELIEAARLFTMYGARAHGRAALDVHELPFGRYITAASR